MADDAAPTVSWSTQDEAWLPSLARAAGTYILDPIGCDRFTGILIFFKITAVSGTTPTLNAYLQTLMPDFTTWADIASITQLNSAAPHILNYMSTGSAQFTVTDGTLAAGTILLAPIGRKLRLKIVIAGTNPLFTFSVQRMLFEKRT